MFQIGSPTALADGAAYERIFKAAKVSSYGLYIPVGAFWGGQDIQKMADRGTLKVHILPQFCALYKPLHKLIQVDFLHVP